MNKLLSCWLLFIAISFLLPWEHRVYFLWDDIEFLMLYRNPSFLEFFLPHEYQVHPFFSFMYWLQIQLFGINPSAFLIISAIFHILNIWLVYHLMKKITKSDFLSLLAAILVSFNKSYFTIIYWPSMFSTVILTTLLLLCSHLFMDIWKRFNSRKTILLFITLVVASLTQGFGVGAGFLFAIAIFIFWKQSEKKYTLITAMSLAAILPLLIILPVVTPEMKQDHIITFSLSRIFNFFYFISVGVSQAIVSRFFLPGFVPNIYSKSNIVIMIALPFTLFCYFILAFMRMVRKKQTKRLMPIFLFGSFTIMPFVVAAIGRSRTGALAALAERNIYVPFFFFILTLGYTTWLVNNRCPFSRLMQIIIISIVIVLTIGHQYMLYTLLDQLFL